MTKTPLDEKQRGAVDAAQVALQSRGYWRTVGQSLRYDKVTLVCGLVLLLIFLSAAFADLIAVADPYKASMIKRLKPITEDALGAGVGVDDLSEDRVHGDL